MKPATENPLQKSYNLKRYIRYSERDISGLREDFEGYDEEVTHISSEISLSKCGIKLLKSTQE